MNKLDFAMSLIRAPFVMKLKDRTFQTLIGTAFVASTGTVAAWRTAGLSVGDKLNVTFMALGAWAAVGAAFTVGDKYKDAKIASAAMEAAPGVQGTLTELAPIQASFSYDENIVDAAMDAFKATGVKSYPAGATAADMAEIDRRIAKKQSVAPLVDTSGFFDDDESESAQDVEDDASSEVRL